MEICRASYVGSTAEEMDEPSMGPLVTVYEVYRALTGSGHALGIRCVEHANPSAGGKSQRKSPSPSGRPYSVIRPSISHCSSPTLGYYRDMWTTLGPL